MTGNTNRVMVTSPTENRRMTTKIVANVRPTGQTRQNTGNPKIAAERRVEPALDERGGTYPSTEYASEHDNKDNNDNKGYQCTGNKELAGGLVFRVALYVLGGSVFIFY
jgi:hypothetical protein